MRRARATATAAAVSPGCGHGGGTVVPDRAEILLPLLLRDGVSMGSCADAILLPAPAAAIAGQIRGISIVKNWFL